MCTPNGGPYSFETTYWFGKQEEEEAGMTDYLAISNLGYLEHQK